MLWYNSFSRITKVVFLQVDSSLAAHVAHKEVDTVMLGFPFLAYRARLLTKCCRGAAFEKSPLMKGCLWKLKPNISSKKRLVFYTWSFSKFGVSGKISSFIKLA